METEVAQPVETSFLVGDMAVHPAHGVGEVTGIEKRDLGGSVNLFYVLRIVDSGLKVMVPVRATAQVGLRRIMSKKEADKVLGTLGNVKAGGALEIRSSGDKLLFVFQYANGAGATSVLSRSEAAGLLLALQDQ